MKEALAAERGPPLKRQSDEIGNSHRRRVPFLQRGKPTCRTCDYPVADQVNRLPQTENSGVGDNLLHYRVP
jgi:hypothetical protein